MCHDFEGPLDGHDQTIVSGYVLIDHLELVSSQCRLRPSPCEVTSPFLETVFHCCSSTGLRNWVSTSTISISSDLSRFEELGKIEGLSTSFFICALEALST